MHTIKTIVEDPEIGAIYKGKGHPPDDVRRVRRDRPGQRGLVHISKLDTKRVEKVEDVVAVGDELLVKVTEIDQQGRINLSQDALSGLGCKAEVRKVPLPGPLRPRAAEAHGTAATEPGGKAE